MEGESPTTPTPSPTTPQPLSRKETAPDRPTEEHPGSNMAVPVPLSRQNAPSKQSELLEDAAADLRKTSTKSSSDSGIEDGKSTPTSVEEKVPFQVFHPRYSRLAVVSRSNYVDSFNYVPNNIKVLETFETEQPPSFPKPEVCEEQVHIIMDAKDPEVSKIHVTPKERSNDVNGSLKAQSPPDSPAPTPSLSSNTTPVSTPRAGQNGGPTKGLAEHAEMSSPYINGGIFSKRYSYASSMASESMDLSINKENMSISSRVSSNGNNMNEVTSIC